MNDSSVRNLPLCELAAVRTGDKGDLVTVAVVARETADHAALARQLTVERVGERLRQVLSGPVHRHELPQLHALLFTCAGVHGGGVSSSLELDTHGKTYGHLLLDLVIEVGCPAAEDKEINGE